MKNLQKNNKNKIKLWIIMRIMMIIIKNKQHISKKMRKAFKSQKEIERLNEDKKIWEKDWRARQKSKRRLGNFDKKLKGINLLKKKRVAKDNLNDKRKEKFKDKRILENILKYIKNKI